MLFKFLEGGAKRGVMQTANFGFPAEGENINGIKKGIKEGRKEWRRMRVKHGVEIIEARQRSTKIGHAKRNQ